MSSSNAQSSQADKENATSKPPVTTFSECISEIQNLRETLADNTKKKDNSNQQDEPQQTHQSNQSSPGWRGNASAIASLVSQTRAQHSAEANNLKASAPRILIVGPSGTGKSTIINTMFGVKTANVRSGGTPVTASFVEHGPYKNIPVRLIDSRGLERGSSYSDQCDEIMRYIEDQNATADHAQHIHIVWYVVGGRWERGDINYIRKLRQYLPVIVIINKCDLSERNQIDKRTGLPAKILLRDSIAKTFDDIDIIFCGDASKQLEGWEPSECSKGHSKEVFEEINNRKRTWFCGYQENAQSEMCEESGKAENQLIGYTLLSDLTMSKLPQAVNLSFIHAQQINLDMKNSQAIEIIKTGVFLMTGVALTPIPFSDMPFLIAAEGYMAVKLFTLYNIPVSFGDVAFFSALNALVIGAMGGAAKIVAGMLKASALGLPVGVVVDMVVASTSGTAIGIAIARVSQIWFLKGAMKGKQDSDEFKKFVLETVKEINFLMLMKAVFQLLIFKDSTPITQMIQANVQGNRNTNA